MLHAQPLNRVLRGLCFDGSGFDPGVFFLHAFCMPLYVPTDHIYLSLGDRLRHAGNERWRLDDSKLTDKLVEVVQREGLPFLETVREPLELVRYCEQMAGSSNPRVIEIIAYSHLFANDLQQAAKVLNHLLSVLDPSIGWQTEIHDRAEGLMATLESDPGNARQMLENWESETIDNLGLGTE